MDSYTFTDNEAELLTQIVEYERELALEDKNEGRLLLLDSILDTLLKP